jgi:hypothetical protein
MLLPRGLFDRASWRRLTAQIFRPRISEEGESSPNALARAVKGEFTRAA